MRVQFIVQGEGRGHMTQALAMRELLVSAGHRVEAVCIGTSDRREVPALFLDNIGAPVTRFRSPNFVTGEGNRGILIGASVWQNLLKTENYLRSLSTIDKVVTSTRPDLVINFYEPLWGLYQKRHRSKATSVCVAHQLLTEHHDFPLPAGRHADKAMLTALNAVTASGSSRKLCLSFTPMVEPDPLNVRAGLVVVPPLLRHALFDLTPTDGDYILAYVLQAGYGQDIIAWHERNPDVKVHCFWDREGAPEVEQQSKNLTFHRLSDVKFLEMMAGCR
ncbi:MAG: glycosyltransferase family protein, partial [Rhodothermia bacterium]